MAFALYRAPKDFILQNSNSCVRDLLALQGNIAFNSVTLNGSFVSGAAGDFVGDGAPGGKLSFALTALQFFAPHPFPVALIAGTMNRGNQLSLLISKNAIAIRLWCGLRQSDPLALALLPGLWTHFVFGQDNDGIVPLTSQLDGLSTKSGSVFSSDPATGNGYIHSNGTAQLGFSPPIITNSPLVAQKVIDLLNTPVSDPSYNLLNP